MIEGLVSEADKRVIPTDEGDIVVVRLAENTFGDWGCSGDLRAVYRELGDGEMVNVSPSDLRAYRNRYNFESYIQTISVKEGE